LERKWRRVPDIQTLERGAPKEWNSNKSYIVRKVGKNPVAGRSHEVLEKVQNWVEEGIVREKKIERKKPWRRGPSLPQKSPEKDLSGNRILRSLATTQC